MKTKQLLESWKQFIAEGNDNGEIENNKSFTNWIFPDKKSIGLEYDVEYKHHIQYDFGDIFPTYDSFESAVKNGKIVSLTKSMDNSVQNRSRTQNMNQLRSLVSSYRSWPEFRNDDTLQEIVEGFKNNSPMKMPFVLEYRPSKFYIMSGNTRLDIAFMMGVVPKVIIVKGY